MDRTTATRARRIHGHGWVVGLMGMAFGAGLLLYAPTLRAVAGSLILFAGFHLLGVGLIGTSAFLGWRNLHPGAAPKAGPVKFSEAAPWLNGAVIAAVSTAGIAIALQAAQPSLWPFAMILLVQGVVFFVGSRVIAGFRRQDMAVLPMVDLAVRRGGRVLDLGCGRGRSTIALALGWAGSITAIDSFGGAESPTAVTLGRNLASAGLESRVEVIDSPQDTLPFEAGVFDAIISVNALDSRAGDGTASLTELHRVLRANGRLLLGVRTPSLAAFAAMNVLSFVLPGPGRWKRRVGGVGFRPIWSGRINGAWFLLCEK